MNVAGKTALYHKLVYEVRYEQGLVYLDRCGTTANQIVQSNPEWIIPENAISPQGAPLVNAVSGTQFTFGPLKYDFALNQPVGRESALTPADVQLFISHVESVTSIVHRELDLKTFLREGFRVWYLFATDSEEDSQDWLAALGAFKTNHSVISAFGGKLESETHIAVVAARDRKFRVAVSAVERQEILDLGTEALKTLPRRLAKGQRELVLQQLRARRRILSNPEFAVMIDVDAYVENPVEIAPSDFIRRSLEAIEAGIPKALARGDS